MPDGQLRLPDSQTLTAQNPDSQKPLRAAACASQKKSAQSATMPQPARIYDIETDTFSEPAPRFKPTQDYILVLPIERKQSEVLLVISGEKFTQGTIAAVGPGKHDRKGRFHELTVKIGDFITYGDLLRGYDFYPEYIEDGIKYRILQEADIAFIAEPDNAMHSASDNEIGELIAQRGTLEIA